MRTWLLPVVFGLALSGPAQATVPGPWTLCMADTVVAAAGRLTLADVVDGPIPSCAAQLVVVPAGEAGQTIILDRRTILRRLSLAGCAGGARLGGSPTTVVLFSGHRLNADAVHAAMVEALAPWLPTAAEGSPAPWMEVDSGAGGLGYDRELVLEPQLPGPLRPGRQTVRFRYLGRQGYRSVTAQVTVHSFVEVARARREVKRGSPLEESDLDWEWFDQADGLKGRMSGRRGLSGMEPVRNLPAGTWLLESDIRPTAVVLAGDPVELRLARGGVTVTVRAHARRDGAMGQAIPVRNDLTGKLVNARVSGPGRVEWRY